MSTKTAFSFCFSDLKNPPPILIKQKVTKMVKNSDSQAAVGQNVSGSATAPAALQCQESASFKMSSDECIPREYLDKNSSDLQYILDKEEEMLELQLRSPATINLNQLLGQVCLSASFGQFRSSLHLFLQLAEETEFMAKSNKEMEMVLSDRRATLVNCVQTLEQLSDQVPKLQHELEVAISSVGPESQYYNLQVMF